MKLLIGLFLLVGTVNIFAEVCSTPDQCKSETECKALNGENNTAKYSWNGNKCIAVEGNQATAVTDCAAINGASGAKPTDGKDNKPDTNAKNQ